MPEVSVCVAVHRVHAPPNLATLAAALPAALAGLEGELAVALNGVDARAVGVPEGAAVADLGENRGVPKGWNAAAGVASAPVLVFVNDDLVPGPGSIRALVEALDPERHPEPPAVVGPCGNDLVPAPFTPGEVLDLSAAPAGTSERRDMVSGFFFATPRSVFDALGGFDEAYTPCTYEEADYCIAAGRVLGRECRVVGGTPFRHEFGVTSRWRQLRRVHWEGQRATMLSIARRNKRRFEEKWSAPAAS